MRDSVAGVARTGALRSSARRCSSIKISGLLAVSAAAGVIVWLTMDWLVLRFSRAHFYPMPETARDGGSYLHEGICAFATRPALAEPSAPMNDTSLV
jgi:hypothetical protein